MLSILARVADHLRSSFWFLPSVMGLAAAGTAVAAVAVDRQLPQGAGPFTWLFAPGANGANAFLAVLAGSIITVLGVAFSITVVALVLASGQFGPRLLRTFMRDRANQVVLGIVVATFVYALMALALNQPAAEGESGAPITVAIGLILGITSLGAFVFFLHHISNQMQADVIVDRVARELMDQIDHYYPDHEKAQGPPPTEAVSAWPHGLEAAESGYIQAIDVKRLLAITSGHDLVARLHRRPGQFVVEGGLLMDVDRSVSAEVEDKLREAVTLGSRRMEKQDLELAIDQLVEVAVRAMSPSLNDPYTAQRVLDRLGQGFCRVAGRQVPSPYLYHDGRFRLEVTRPDFQQLADQAFSPIRENAADSKLVMERFLKNLHTIGECTTDEAHRRILQHHADLALADGRRAIENPADLHGLQRLHDSITATLSTRP